MGRDKKYGILVFVLMPTIYVHNTSKTEIELSLIYQGEGFTNIPIIEKRSLFIGFLCVYIDIHYTEYVHELLLCHLQCYPYP